MGLFYFKRLYPIPHTRIVVQAVTSREANDKFYKMYPMATCLGFPILFGPQPKWLASTYKSNSWREPEELWCEDKNE